MKTLRADALICYAAATALALAILRWPYEYYLALRVFILFVGVVLFATVKRKQGTRIASVLLFFVILFNPIWPIHLDRNLWSVLNLFGAAYFIYLAKKF